MIRRLLSLTGELTDMKNTFDLLIKSVAALLAASILFSQEVAAEDDTVHVLMETSMGPIELELYADKAPATVANFVENANSGFYDGTIFHRVISSFMIQGGGFTPDMQKKTTREPIANEANNGLSNKRGTIAMARLPQPHSATAQFFINVQNNMNLDYQGQSNWGYAVFGKVTHGMDVVDDIRFVKTKSERPFSDVPVEPVIIKQVTILKRQGLTGSP